MMRWFESSQKGSLEMITLAMLYIVAMCYFYWVHHPRVQHRKQLWYRAVSAGIQIMPSVGLPESGNGHGYCPVGI